MDPQGSFLASLLDASGRSYALAAVTRLAEAHEAEVELWGFAKLAADAQARVGILAEAAAAGRPELLRREVEWLASTYKARGVDVTLLEGSLVSLRDELRDALPTQPGELAASYLDEAHAAVAAAPDDVPTALVDDAPHVTLARTFLLAILEGRRDDALGVVLEALEAGVSVADLHHHVLAASLAELGRMWQVGEGNIAEEHLGTRVVEDTLVLLRSRAPREQPNRRRVLVASVRGNLHELGARMVGDQFELAGWRTMLLGGDMPAADTAAAVEQFGADLVALSVGRSMEVRATAEAVSTLKEHQHDVPVLVGGRPFQLVDDLWRVVGADGSAIDAPAAVREGERLVATRDRG